MYWSCHPKGLWWEESAMTIVTRHPLAQWFSTFFTLLPLSEISSMFVVPPLKFSQICSTDRDWTYETLNILLEMGEKKLMLWPLKILPMVLMLRNTALTWIQTKKCQVTLKRTSTFQILSSEKHSCHFHYSMLCGVCNYKFTDGWQRIRLTKAVKRLFCE